MGDGNAAPRHYQVIRLQRAERAEGDIVIPFFREIIMAGTGTRGIVDIDIVIAAGDHILKALAGLQVFPR